MTNSLRGEILETFALWNRKLGRPLTAVETWRALPRRFPLGEVVVALTELALAGELAEENGFYALFPAPASFSLARRAQDLLLDMKWRKLRRRARWFRHLPFIEFVGVSGSLALGTVSPTSDFDILLGIRQGRMFMARYLALALFTLLGARRMDEKKHSSPEKLCFNHFVTEGAYMKPPYNRYRRELYRNFIPLFGVGEPLRKFVRANGWSGLDPACIAATGASGSPSGIRRLLECLFGGRTGDFLERRVFAPFARWRLSRYLAGRDQTHARTVVSERELEFHFDLSGEHDTRT